VLGNGKRIHGFDGDLIQNKNDKNLYSVDRSGVGYIPEAYKRFTIKGKYREWVEIKIGNKWYVASEYNI